MAFIEVKGTGRSSLSAKAILTGIFSLKGDVRTGIISQALPMAIHNEDFLPTLQHLLPPGSLWTKLADAELTKLLRAISYSFTNVLRRGKNLIDEADPRTTNELLPDWERLLALPECTPGPTALEERRNEVVSKLNGFKDPNTQNIIDLASELGYTISIRTFKPFVAGS
ncbi:DUF2313 domain-containing protein, partial [Candidatus Pacearchaeota archaeon]|nr:DUF2313 domain-containing protein [Candidatus Pacearchaeota archaeon]